MDISIKKAFGLKIMGSDGPCGKVHDLYFDDQTWKVRHFVIALNPWQPWSKVLISPDLRIQPISLKKGMLTIKMTRAAVKNAPDFDNALPVFRQQQKTVFSCFQASPYDPSGLFLFAGHRKNNVAQNRDPHLRSAREVIGYRVSGPTGPKGYVSDLLGADNLSRIQEIDLSTGWALRRPRERLEPSRVREINWAEKTLYLL